MIVWFYRKAAIDKARAAVEECPALTLRDNHPSLVMFRREHQNESHPSVLLFDNYAELQKFCVELHGERAYTAVAVDLFGDTWTRDELAEMLNRSEYAFKEPGGMGENVYRIQGKFGKQLGEINWEHVAENKAADEEREEMEKNILQQCAVLDRGLGIGDNPDLLRRLIKAGFNHPNLFSGANESDLIATTFISEDEASFVIEKAKVAKLI